MADETTKCLICQTPIKKTEYLNRGNNKSLNGYDCPRCGNYYVDSYTEGYIQQSLRDHINNRFDEQKVAKLSHWVRTKHGANKPNERGFTKLITIDKILIDNIIENPIPNPSEQADNLIRWLGENSKGYGEFLDLEESKDLSLIGSATPNEFVWIAHHLIDSKVIEGNITSRGMNVRLSFDGWKYFEELKRRATDSRKAFMAMQYGDERLNKIFEDVFKLAVKQTGFEIFILQERPKAGLIDDRLRVEIQTSRFLIADLTHENAGAYWEAGYAEGLGKPVIYTCEKKKFEEKKTHFDTNHHLTILWDLDDTETTAEELKATIRATLPVEAKLTDE